jgi:hypothetical protein
MNTSIETGIALETVIHEFAFAHALLIVLGIQHLQNMYQYGHLRADAESHIQQTRLGCSFHKPGTTRCCKCPNAGTSYIVQRSIDNQPGETLQLLGKLKFLLLPRARVGTQTFFRFVLSASSHGPTNVTARISSQGLEHDAVQGKLDHNHFIM